MKRRVVVIVAALVFVAAIIVAVRATSNRFADAGPAAPSTGNEGLPPVIPTPKSDQAATNLGWQLTGEDDFTGNKINTNDWSVYDGATSHEKWSAQQCQVSGGVLTLVGDSQPPGTTCGIASNDNRTYGRWEVRARFPAPAAVAYDPVFLLWPENDANATAVGEIDFAEEYDPARQYIESWLHGPGNVQAGYGRKYVDLTKWHNFAVEWQADHVTCFIDGVAWVGYTDVKNVPSKPMHLVLQQNYVPRTAADVRPIRSTAEIDWVRFYR